MANYWFDLVSGNDLECPHCKARLDVTRWHTEYGDPLPGDHAALCPKCDKEFTIGVEVQTIYTPKIEVDRGL